MGAASRRWGAQCLGGGASLLATVPSVIVPEESNVLINPRHPGCAELVIRVHRQWNYDDRLL
ncbi:RES family NAD+ phosphorylase [Synechococcus sp. CBW1006]|uniref:RES family NAD+ phosphorylase n=1 Tax=Synechococcus sp. CBW1006 TaxID=1353138 RepID=UPI0018CCC419|nr:RES family NAD+ phosphorylase [Synechococcus sp. CBW1006]QPN66540.1 RES family NAD+ phosphorylase [Synechococcus sp. CBW1006]